MRILHSRQIGSIPRGDRQRGRHAAARLGVTVWLMALVSAAAPAVFAFGPMAQGDGVRIYAVEDSYDFVKESLRIGITNQGLLISSTMHINEMLERTGADLEMPEDPYRQAEAFEFCSAKLSHMMIQAHPANAAMCPFSIAVYTLVNDPELVYVAFRTSQLLGEEEAATAAETAITDTLDAIVRDAIAF